MPYFELKKGDLNFPPAHFADLDGLLAVGGEMTAERLLLAYQNGLYYWHHPMKHIKWWSPDPRIVLDPRTLPLPGFEPVGLESTENQAFEALLRLCQQEYNDASAMGPPWLSERMFRIFMELDRKGLVHSQEVWREGQLVGGFFGVCLGEVCFGEYCAGTAPGAASLAIVEAARTLGDRGFRLLDMQKETARCGDLEYEQISRLAYVDFCREAAARFKEDSNTNPL